MIALNCTSCKKLLEIDDAFAGGVCRCQHCGTIQTVPSNAKRAGSPQPSISKMLYQKKPRGPGEPGRTGSGLEALADSVGASSGLARSALKTRAPIPTQTLPPKPRTPVRLLAAAGAVILVLLAIILWLATR
jgi:hypothetical protein